MLLLVVPHNVAALSWQEISDSIMKVQCVRGENENVAYLNKLLRNDARVTKHISGHVNIGDTLILLERVEGGQFSKLWIKGRIVDTYADFHYSDQADSLLFNRKVELEGNTLLKWCDEWRIEDLKRAHLKIRVLDAPHYMLTRVVFRSLTSYEIECQSFAGFSDDVILIVDSIQSDDHGNPYLLPPESLEKFREALRGD